MKEELYKIAYDSINEIFGGKNIDKETLLTQFPSLSEKKATFITLNKNGKLRGCIGSLVPTKSLLEDIISNAKSAAFRDYRFDVLCSSEFKDIDIEISILTMPKEVKYVDTQDLKSKIKINIDGVILKLGNAQSTFLPQVWDSLNTFESFFQALCEKAGCSSNCLREKPLIFTYQVEKIKKQ